jgi:hypothetical protein
MVNPEELVDGVCECSHFWAKCHSGFGEHGANGCESPHNMDGKVKNATRFELNNVFTFSMISSLCYQLHELNVLSTSLTQI